MCGLGHALRVQKKLEGSIARPLGRTKRPGVQVFHLHDDSSREVLSEPGHVQALFETWRRGRIGAHRRRGGALSDPRRSHLHGARAHGEGGRRAARARIRSGSRSQFARNQAIARGALAPDLFELTIAARGVASDDFAWHVWDLGVTYPHQTDRPDLAVYRLTLDELQHGARRLWFRRRRKTRRHALRLVALAQERADPGRVGRSAARAVHLQLPARRPAHRSVRRLSEEARQELARGRSARASRRSSRVSATASICARPSATSSHDGRISRSRRASCRRATSARCAWSSTPKIATNRYPWTVTWQGEHEEESDMALYATPPERAGGGAQDRALRVRRLSHDLPAGPHVPRLRRSVLRRGRDQGRAPALRRDRLLRRALDRLRRRQAAAPQARRIGAADGQADRLPAHRPALAGAPCARFARLPRARRARRPLVRRRATSGR